MCERCICNLEVKYLSHHGSEECCHLICRNEALLALVDTLFGVKDRHWAICWDFDSDSLLHNAEGCMKWAELWILHVLVVGNDSAIHVAYWFQIANRFECVERAAKAKLARRFE